MTEFPKGTYKVNINDTVVPKKIGTSIILIHTDKKSERHFEQIVPNNEKTE